MSLPLNKYRKVAVDFCSDQGAMKEHSLGSVTEEQRRAGQKDQDLVCNGFSGNDTRYLRLSQDFFTQNSRFFEEKGEESIRWVEMGLDDEEATLAQWQRVNDQAEVIQWYRFFIGAKLDRAASGIDEMDNEDWGRPEQSDANCTARILM